MKGFTITIKENTDLMLLRDYLDAIFNFCIKYCGKIIKCNQTTKNVMAQKDYLLDLYEPRKATITEKNFPRRGIIFYMSKS